MLRFTVDLHSWWVLDFSFLREFIAKSSISDYDKTHLQLKGVVKRGRNHRFTGGDSGFVLVWRSTGCKNRTGVNYQDANGGHFFHIDGRHVGSWELKDT